MMITHMASSTDPKAVVIPDERQQYLIDFLQKLDRMMTGLPLRLIVKNIGDQHGWAETDGKRLWMDWNVLRRPMRTETRLGLNYHEIGHCYYGDPHYDRDVADMKLASNILLDCRDETLFATTYPAVIPYFVSMVQELLINNRGLEDCSNIWPLLYGRKYLPSPVRFVSAPRSHPQWVKDTSAVIDKFVMLAPERANVPEMLELTKTFHEQLQSYPGHSPLVNPGGGRLIRGSRKVVNDISDEIRRKITITIDADRGELKKRLRLRKDAKGTAASGIGSGAASGSKRDVEKLLEEVDVEIIERVSNRSGDITTETKTQYLGTEAETVEVGDDITPRGDSELETEHADNASSGGAIGGVGGAGGGSLQAVELIEEDDDDVEFTEYVWVGTDLDNSWKHGKDRLNRFKDVLTTDSVKDIVRSLEAEVLFDTDQLAKAGWDGFGAVTAHLRGIRDTFDKDLQLSARTLRKRHALGKRGSVSMKAAMKAERLPDNSIFSSSTNYLTRHKLELEVVMLIDASGSMDKVIQQAMKVQWVIGSAFEKRGAKVTLIPFNNKARDPLKGRDDKFSDRIFPYCPASGGTQPTAALSTAQEIFEKSGNRMKLLFILTDGAWNNAHWSHKIIDNMNHRGVMSVLIFMGGDAHDMSSMKKTHYHHCKEGFRVSGMKKLLPEMRKTFLKEFNKAIVRTLRRYY